MCFVLSDAAVLDDSNWQLSVLDRRRIAARHLASSVSYLSDAVRGAQLSVCRCNRHIL